MKQPRTFVIGDVHGHIDRLKALVARAGVADDEQIVQLGDLGHYDAESRERDLATWTWVKDRSNFRVLWGNHDAAVFSPLHRFRGYADPLPGTVALMKNVGLWFGAERHGFLLTHSGLATEWMDTLDRETAYGLWFALENKCYLPWSTFVPERDSVSFYRGGMVPHGGILWRDEREALAPVLQVFGHSRGTDIRLRSTGMCIDIAGKAEEDDSLAGIWLPDMKVVAVGKDAAFIERSLDDQVDTDS